MAPANALSSFLHENSAPVDPDRKYYTLFGIETAGISASRQDLFFVDGGDQAVIENGRIVLKENGTLSSGIFRNSFYYSVYARSTFVRRLFLAIAGTGGVHLKVWQSASNKTPATILAADMVLVEDEPRYIRLPDIDSYWLNGRVFWEVRSIGHSAEIGSLELVTDERPVREPKVAVLIRTYGRTSDVIRLLSNLIEQQVTREHRDFITKTKFVVLDTSPAALPSYTGLLESCSLNLAVLTGANLGGGGNAAQILYRVIEDEAAAVDEIVVMDDDLEISLETLCRYRAFTRYRTQDVITTCPVLMKSEPNVVWEDGGYWGRFHPTQMSAQRSSLFPRLLKHGWRLNGFDHVDDFGQPTSPEYATFIFFAAPASIFRRLGYPVAFFLRGDDIEFSLRAGAAGIKMLSNPNMCAWHEPAHSYGQEFMAILHGIIINFKYSLSDRDTFVKFFNGRFQAHASYRDALGLSVYVKVLEILTGQNAVLREGFQNVYIEALADFKKLERPFEPVERRIIDEVLQDGRGTAKLAPFLYMPPNDTAALKTLILENHPHKTICFRHPDDESENREFYLVARKFCDSLEMFMDKYDDLSRDFSQRLSECASRDFWHPILGELPFSIETSKAAPAPAPSTLPSRDELPQPVKDGHTKDRMFKFMRKKNVPDDSADRLPEGFDELIYLRLNPDVAGASMSARSHYLKYGRAEGRLWKIGAES